LPQMLGGEVEQRGGGLHGRTLCAGRRERKTDTKL
jgi:hypothetical protein